MKKKLINLSLVFVSTCFALLLAEVIVRIFLPQTLFYKNDGIWRPDSKFGWRHRENANVKANFGEAEITFRTDENGYRINADGYVDSDTSSQNILVLGDSFLEAVQVENRNTFPQILQEKLNLLPGVNTHFYNSAVSGWDPNHYFLEGQRVLENSQLKTDHVLVFLYTANDIVGYEVEGFEAKDKYNRSFRIPGSFKWGEISNALLYPLGDYLDRKSQFYMLVKRRNRKLMTKLGLSSYYFPYVFRTQAEAFPTWETTTQICKKIARAFGEREIPVSFVLIPTTYQVNEAVMQEYIGYFDIDIDSVDLEQPNRILKERFAQDSMRLYDPLEFFREKTQAGDLLYGKVDPHFNAHGHNALAEFLFPLLSNELKPR